MEQKQQQEKHFLVVSFPAQGHINPTLQLAKRLVRLGARVTFSTSVYAHRRMFPSSSSSSSYLTAPVESPPSPLHLSHFPYSDGYDDGLDLENLDRNHYLSQLKSVGSQTLSDLVRSLAAEGRRVNCVLYNFLVPWAADVARDAGVPSSALYWIQPATVFCIYYRYFHGYADLIASHNKDPSFPIELPGLPPLRIRDFPSLLTSNSREEGAFFPVVEELFRSLDRKIGEGEEGNGSKPRVLVNTFDALEHDELLAVDEMELIPIGPSVPSAYTDGVDQTDTAFGGDLLKSDSRDGCAEWLDSKPDRSVVYVSFGSYSVLPTRQREEISRGLAESGRPYLWVVRENREGVEEGGEGLVVEWCSQLEVLSHRAVGCFVTHCGWNSTVESLTCGVPTVGLPQWTDQVTNARLVEAVWGVGVRAEVDGEGLLDGRELRRCLDLVMGEGERGVEIRRNAAAWRARAREAVREGGSSDRNLRAFVMSFSHS